MSVAYALRAEYAEGFLGGRLRIDEARPDYDVLAELDAGNGAIVVADSDAPLIAVLDAYDPLKRVAAGDRAPTGDTGYGAQPASTLRAELKRRDLPAGGTKPELVTRLTDHDAARAVGEDAVQAFRATLTNPTPEG